MRLVSMVLLMLASGCGSPTGQGTAPVAGQSPAESSLYPVDDAQVVATVSGVPVTVKEFQSAAARRVPANGDSLSAEERAEVLDELVQDKLLYLEARRLGIDRDPKVQQMMVSTLLRRTIYSRVRNSDFTEEELKAYFDAHPDEFSVPEKRQVKRIFVRATPDRPMAAAIARAGEARDKILDNPGGFADIASEYSEDPYRKRGGDVGFVSKEGKPGVPSAVVSKAFSMEDGGISEVFEADGGANVIYVARLRERIDRTFEQMKGSVLRKVRTDRLNELLDSYVEQVEGNYDVERREARLADIDVQERVAPMNTDLSLPGAPAGAEVELKGGGHP